MRARFSAVLGVMALVLVPFIHVTVYWFRTLHPDPVVLKPEGPSLPGVMLVTLLSSIAVCTLLYVGLVMQRYALAVLRDIREEEEAGGGLP
jgi:heme exporter protein C